MSIKLLRAGLEDAELIWNMQIKSFSALLKKYKDFDTNPGNESIEIVTDELKCPSSYFYLILMNNETVGAIRVVIMEDGIEKRISPIFVLPEYQNQGIAQNAITEAERIHGADNWALETVLQEKKNCYLYEKWAIKTQENLKKSMSALH